MTDQGEVQCVACGAGNSPTAKFCRACGKAITATPVCASCGAELHAGARYCRACGAVTGGPPVLTQTVSARPRGGLRDRRLWLGLGAVAAIGIVLVAVLVSRGGGDPNGGATGKTLQVNHDGRLTLGASTALASKSVPTAGGSVVVQKAGDPLNGLQLDVPPNAFDGQKAFAISSRPITAQTFGTAVDPISPLIRVDYGEGFTPEPMTVRVPIKLPAGNFAMGVYYNESTGALEGIPVMELASDHVTLLAGHFSEFFITSIAESLLLDLSVDTGFVPGRDDWQFTNYGSYTSTGGICAGMSLSALWYYKERHLGAGQPHLNGRYDNDGASPPTPAVWEDDSLGLRLASVVQHDYQVDTGVTLYGAFEKLSKVDPRVNYLSIAYGMELTGPVYLSVRNTGAAGGGHAIVAYKIQNRTIYVSDPNRPGNTARTISFTNDQLQGYSSAEKLGGPGKVYDWVRYMAVSALVDYSLIGQRWAELDAGTIGDADFPAWEVGIYDLQGGGYRLDDVLAVTGTEQMVWTDIPSTKDLSGMSVLFDGRWTPGRLENNEATSTLTLTLNKGPNSLAVVASGKAPGSSLAADWGWLGFGRYTIEVVDPVSISAPASIVAAQPVSFSASAPSPVTSATYEWDFGDGTATVRSRTTVSHTFAKAGSYKVIVTAFDGPTGKYGGQGTVTVTTGAAITPTPVPSRPTPTPTSKYDCSKPPPGDPGSIENILWSLACGGPIGGGN